MQLKTLSRCGIKTKVKFMLRVLEKIHVGSEEGIGQKPTEN
jgi:hypothetical protein